MKPTIRTFDINGRTYRPPPRPIVVVCIDGCADEYLSAALARDRMPVLARFCRHGYRGLARSALPSFTNTNNASITTGVAPAVHGISGNFFLDAEDGQEVMMNSSRFLRCETILAAAAAAGRKVGFVTAKDKLRELFSKNLISDDSRAIAFSAEKASEATRAVNGIEGIEALVGEPTPPIYSAAASVFAMKAGTALLREQLADFLYVSLTDFMQHKHAPEDEAVLDFYAALDAELGHYVEAGAVVGITADHGMNAKQTLDGEPNVRYLETLLAEEVQQASQVILPITDPYVVHHGALGSFAVVHLPEGADVGAVRSFLARVPGVTEVYERDEAAIRLELPPDRIGDLVVLSGRDVVLGRSPEHHDLEAIAGGLRSHGGRYEEMVPFVFSEPLSDAYLRQARGDPRNFDVFDFTVNGTVS